MEYGPQDVWTHVYYAAVLSTARRGDDILPHVEKMREFDPLNPIVNAHVALFLFHANRGEEAIAAAEKSLELFPDFRFLHWELSYFRWQQRDRDAAIAGMRKADEMTGESIPLLWCFLAAMNFDFGHLEEGERLLARVEKMSETLLVFAIGRIVVEVVREPEGVKSLLSRLSTRSIVVARQEIGPHRDGSD